MIGNKILLCCVLVVFSSCSGHTENTFKRITAIGNVVSEIDKSIWVIFQDKKNNYWFGSNQNGVYCYDGNKLEQFTTKEGLCNNQIRGIQEDKLGNIYFDTPAGVSKFNGEKFISLIPIESPANQWKLQPDDLWFKSKERFYDACRYDGDTLYKLKFSSISSKKFKSNSNVYCIYKDNKGNIWFGTETEGVGCFNGMALHWIYEDELGPLEDGRAPAIRSILEDKDDYFWFSNLLYQYKIQNNNQKSIEYERVRKIQSFSQQERMKLPYYTSALLDNGNVWMTNYNEGVWKYDGKNLINYALKDRETDVQAMYIYQDNKGVIWLGTDNSGVYKFNGEAFEKFKP